MHSPENASTAGNVYTNFFFQFRYSFSESWVDQAAEADKQLKVHGPICADDRNVKFYDLLTLSRTVFGSGAAGHSRAVIFLTAEDISSNPEVTSGKDCALNFAERLKKSHYTPLQDPKEMKISGRTFFRQDLKGTSADGTPIFQSAVFTLTKGYAVGFLFDSPSQTMLTNMVRTLDKMEFY